MALASVAFVATLAFWFWSLKNSMGARPPLVATLLVGLVLFAGFRVGQMGRQNVYDSIRNVLGSAAPLVAFIPNSPAPGGENTSTISHAISQTDVISGVFKVRRAPTGDWEFVENEGFDLDLDKAQKDEFELPAKPGQVIKAPLASFDKAWNGSSTFDTVRRPDGEIRFFVLAEPILNSEDQVEAVLVMVSPMSAWTSEISGDQLVSTTLCAVAILITLACSVIVTQLQFSLFQLRLAKAEAASQQDQIRDHMRIIAEKNQEMAENQSRLAEAYGKLRALATTDGLTGVLNHRALMDFLTSSMRSDHGFGSPVSVILIDVDNFKMLNDQFGHPAGDEALRVIAAVLAHSAPPGSAVGRYGGEEFMLVLPGASESAATAVAEELRRRVMIAKTSSRPVTISVGVSTVYSLSKSEQQLIDESDRAMYFSKRNGKNRVTHFGQGLIDTSVSA